MNVAIGGTFACDSLEMPLKSILQKINIAKINLSWMHYGFVSTVLLQDNTSLPLDSLVIGINVLLIRIEDLLKAHPELNSNTSEEKRQLVVKKAARCLREAFVRESSAKKLTIVLCPASTSEAIFEQAFIDEIMLEKTRINCISSSKILESFSQDHSEQQYYNATGDLSHHSPYFPVMYSVLSVWICRAITQDIRALKKVIVLDCDNTLWSGLAGEDSVVFTQGHLFLQKFVLQQQQEGMLLCLSSKNNAKDVIKVFKMKQMVLSLENHVTISKINWRSKSSNMREIAAELNLSLQAFVFIDDSPMECHEVSTRCPEVTVLRLPECSSEFPDFLKQCWVFDKKSMHVTSSEDLVRTELYKSQLNRTQEATTFTSDNAFIASLNVQVCIAEADKSSYDRLWQLSQRTNQFNTSCWRISSAEELANLHLQEGVCVYSVSVTDRFGFYGVVGLVITESLESVLNVPLLLLSCRVLNRGVEYQVLRYLATTSSVTNDYKMIHFPFVVNDRNLPAREFFSLIASDSSAEGVWKLSVQSAAEVKFSGIKQQEHCSYASQVLQLIINGFSRISNYVQSFFNRITLEQRGDYGLPNIPLYLLEHLQFSIDEVEANLQTTGASELHRLIQDSASSSMEESNTCKMRRKMRHQVKVLMHDYESNSSKIYTATEERIANRFCETPNCKLKTQSNCVFSRCKACCLQIQLSLNKFSSMMTEEHYKDSRLWKIYNLPFSCINSKCTVHVRKKKKS